MAGSSSHSSAHSQVTLFTIRKFFFSSFSSLSHPSSFPPSYSICFFLFFQRHDRSLIAFPTLDRTFYTPRSKKIKKKKINFCLHYHIKSHFLSIIHTNTPTYTHTHIQNHQRSRYNILKVSNPHQTSRSFGLCRV